MYYADMYRKGCLSVYWKNELRKHRAEKRDSSIVTITHHFPVSIPKADISIFKISISKEYYLNVMLKSLDSLKRKMEASSVVPAGLFILLIIRGYNKLQVGLMLPHSFPAVCYV